MYIVEENDDEINNVTLIGKTIKMDDGNNSTALIIHKELSKALDIENSNVFMSMLEDCDGDKHLLVTKYHREIIID